MSAPLTGLGLRDAPTDARSRVFEAVRWGSQPPVGNSEDLKRILALPWREKPTREQQEEMAEVMTALLRRDNPACECARLSPGRANPCITQLNPIQGWYLYEGMLGGGAIGHIVAGGGKCLAAGSEIFDARQGRRRDISEITGAVTVPSLIGRTLGLAEGQGFPSGSKPCWRVALADGSHLDASYDHRLLTARGWVEAAQLRIGDYVAVPTRVPAGAPAPCTEAEATLIGLLLADGGLAGAQARFTNETPEVIAEFQRCANEVCSGWSEQLSQSNAREFSLLGGAAFREKWGLFGLAREKRAHEATWGFSDSALRALLRAFWACDGHVGERRVECVLASEKLIDDVRFWALRLGVRLRKRFKKSSIDGVRFDSWRLVAEGQQAVNFLATLGDIPGKEAACQALRMRLESTKRNTNYDTVPIGPTEFHEICAELGLQGRAKGEPRGDGRRGRAREILWTCPGRHVARQRFTQFCLEFAYTGRYSHLNLDGVAWEKCTSLTPIGEVPVFDLSVPGPCNFVANGMVVHNTGIDILLPMVAPDCKRAVVLVPPGLRAQFRHDFERWSQHFKTPNLAGGRWFVEGRPVLTVVAYTELSSKSFATFLEVNKPQVLIFDEAQALANRSATRTDRLLAYAEGHGGVRYFPHSGSLTANGLDDCAHLFTLALGDGSPLPNENGTVLEWATAIDPGEDRAPVGALAQLCEKGEGVRSGFRRRMVNTRGVISTVDAEVSAKLELHQRVPPPMPDKVKEALALVRTRSIRPDLEEADDKMTAAMWARQVAAGFYYFWRYPRGEPAELIERWFKARSAYFAAVRHKLEGHRAPLMDSPGYLKDAAMRYLQGYRGELPVWRCDELAPWLELEDQVQPVQGTAWIDDWLMRDAVQWGKENIGVIWYLHRACGQKIAQLGGFPYFGEGEAASEAIALEKGNRTIVASLKAHGTGKNLEFFSRALMVNNPASGWQWEQGLARLHRRGQEAKCVRFDVYRHTREYREAIETAEGKGEYVQESTGKSERLLAAEKFFNERLDG